MKSIISNWQIPLKVFAFSIILGAICIGFVYIAAQQVIRSGANDPQIQLAEDMARQLESGVTLQAPVAESIIDIAKSSAPFILIFNEQGKATFSSATLDGSDPSFPQGVLQYAKAHGENRVTWQPRQGVRIAVVVRYFDGPNPGYVVAGKSLKEAEGRIGNIGKIALSAGLAFAVISTILSFLFFKNKS